HVLDAPITGNGTTINEVEGAGFTATLATYTDTNPITDIGDYNVSVNWGDGSAADSCTHPCNAGNVQVQNTGTAGSFRVVGTHTYTEETPGPITAASSYTISISFSDVGGAVVTPNPVTSHAGVADAALTAGIGVI